MIIAKDNFPQIECIGEANEVREFAASELERYLRLVLGLEDVPPRGSNRITLQQTLDGDQDEAYALKSTADHLEISASNDNCLLFGVYDFLRSYCGCIFSGLGTDGEHIPFAEKIKIAPMNEKRVSAYGFRSLQLYWVDNLEQIISRLDWMAKNGYNYVTYTIKPDGTGSTEGSFDPETGENRDDEGEALLDETSFRKILLPHIVKRGLKLEMGVHNLFYFISPDLYFEKHPEWFALRDGKRSPAAQQLALCTSNREMVREFIHQAKEFLRRNPETDILGVDPMDGGGACECENCRAMDDTPDAIFHKGGYYEKAANYAKINRYVKFINEVAAGIKDEFPLVKVRYLAYGSLFSPPKEGTRFEDNVYILVDFYWRCSAHPISPHTCAKNNFIYRSLQRWKKLCPTRIITSETFMGMHAQSCLPFENTPIICRDWSYMNSGEVYGCLSQTRDGCFKSHLLNYYTFGKMAWSPGLEYSYLLKEFLLGMYGECGIELVPIYQKLFEGLSRIEQNFSLSPYLRCEPEKVEACLQPNGYNSVFFLEAVGKDFLLNCVENAENKATSKREKNQISQYREYAEYWILAADALKTVYGILLDKEPGKINVDKSHLLDEAEAKINKVLDFITPRINNGWFYKGLEKKWKKKLEQCQQKCRTEHSALNE